jgi:hypothetical protein
VVFTNYNLKNKKRKKSNLKINLKIEHAQLIKYAGAIAEPLGHFLIVNKILIENR